MSDFKSARKGYFTSGLELNRHVFPLNLSAKQGNEKIARKSVKRAVRVPEFVQEYIREPLSYVRPNVKSSLSHRRTVSLGTASVKFRSHREEKPKEKPIKLSYIDFKSRHASHAEGRLLTSQINKRTFELNHSSKPIMLNQSLYYSKRSSNYQGLPETNRKVNEGEDHSLSPGLTYGEKIIRLRALVTANVLELL